jgi:hypothetical protein
MNHSQIVADLITYIQKVESEKGEISLFEWSHSLRCKLLKDYGIEDLDTRRKLYIEAYNATHPHRQYKLN